jgi:hypothetical protein
MRDAWPALRIEAQESVRLTDKLLTMQEITSSWLFLAPLGGVLTWVACHWWYGRQRRRLEYRFGKLQADRDGLQEQVKRARQQVAQLQKELSTWRLASVTTAAGKANGARAIEPPAAAPPTGRVVPELPAGLVFETPQLAAHGFADTQPFDSDAVAGLARKRS